MNEHQEDGNCLMSTYTKREDGSVSVLNRARKGSVKGESYFHRGFLK